MYRTSLDIRLSILLSGAIFGVGGCSPGPGSTTRPGAVAEQYRLTATIQDLMDGIVDPSADVLWDSVAYIATTKGVEDRQPRTEEEWKAVRYGAITLIEAANLLSMPGRRVASAQVPAAPEAPPGLGELSRSEIQQRIESTHDSFTQFARGLQDAASKALTAIDAKDPQALLEAGGIIDQACEACHVIYWYPNQNRAGN